MSDMDFTELARIAADRPLNNEELEHLNSHNGGLDKALGFRYTHISHGLVRVELEVGDHLMQPAGVVNGGTFCALAESAGSIAGMIVAGQPVVGVNNDTNFIRSVGQGVIVAEARPIQTGRRTQLWEILMTNDDRLVARSTLRTMPASA